MASNAFIGLGSNRGDRLAYLKSALQSISKNNKCKLLKTSSVYETKAFGVTDQNNFYNAVIKIETTYLLKDLFVFLKELEKSLGRVQSERWGPREIDLDILMFDDLVFSDEIITVPHKGILERDFVFLPLMEIEPDIVHPKLEKKIRDLDLLASEKNIISKHPNSFITEQEEY